MAKQTLLAAKKEISELTAQQRHSWQNLTHDKANTIKSWQNQNEHTAQQRNSQRNKINSRHEMTNSSQEGDIGVCGIGQFFMRYFGNFNLELRYCGILETCRTRFLGVLVDDSWYKKRSLHIFRPFLAVSGRFGSNLKQPYFIAHFFK